MPPFPQIDGYRITRLIGQGGMARVYAAVEAELEREVAIKIVSLDPNCDMEITSRLEFEARSLARLRHPHIVELYRFGRLSTTALYYVMPLLTGGDLGDWLKPVAESKVCALMRDLLDALGHAHQAGIVHRDVKPENILFDQHGRVQLADFGAAFAFNSSAFNSSALSTSAFDSSALDSSSSKTTRLTQEGFAIGSLGYMSPEQARGQEVSGLSDLYSLAVVAFELLTDSRCHSGDDAVAIALAQIEQPPAQLPRELAHWQAFFARALNPSPPQRYPSAAAMKAALPSTLIDASVTQAASTGSSLSSTTQLIPLAQPSKMQKSPKKRLIAALLGAGFLGAVSLSGAAWYAWNKNQRQAQQVQQQQFERLQLQLAQVPEDTAPELLSKSASILSASQASMLAAKIIQRMLRTIQSLALAEGDASANLNAIAAPWTKLDLLRRQYQLSNIAELVELEAALTRRVEETLVLASEQFDRRTAQRILPLAQALLRTQPKLSVAMQRAASIPEIGGEFTDVSGLRMRLVTPPKSKSAGFAVMANALTAREFDRYASALKLRPKACVQAGVRGCMDQKQANAIASWYSKQSGALFKVPNTAEWKQTINLAPRIKNKFAVSRDECRVLTQTQRPNALKRTLGNIKGFFGGQKAQSISTQSCGGELVFALDGSGKSTVASSEKTVLVLVKVLR